MNPTEREVLLAEVFQWVREENGGRLPFKAYQQRVRMWHTPFVDVAILIQKPQPRVLLERRPKTGHLYPGMLDFPGGNFLHMEGIYQAAMRIAGKLLFATEEKWIPRFVGVASYVRTEAEVGISFLFIVEIGEEPNQLPESCEFYLLNSLPSDVVPWQLTTYPGMIQGEALSCLVEYEGQ